MGTLKVTIHKYFDRWYNKSLQCFIQPVIVSHAVRKEKSMIPETKVKVWIISLLNTCTVFLTFSRLPSVYPFLSLYSILSFLVSVTH